MTDTPSNIIAKAKPKVVKPKVVKPVADKKVVKRRPGVNRCTLNLDKLKEVASITHTIKEIAVVMGCSEEALYKNPKYRKIIDDCKVTIKHSLKTQLLNLALAGDIKCLFYALNNYSDFSDKKVVEVKTAEEVKIPTLAEMYDKFK